MTTTGMLNSSDAAAGSRPTAGTTRGMTSDPFALPHPGQTISTRAGT